MLAIVVTLVPLVLILGGLLMLPKAHRLTKPEDRRAFKSAAWVFLVLGAVFGFLSTTFIVGAAEVAVPISFGRAGDPIKSGFRVKAPWTKIESFPTRPFSVPDVSIVARTSQGGQVTAVVGARWHVDPDKARDTYLQIRTGDEEKITREVVDKGIGQAVGNVFVTKTNMDATTDRKNVESGLLTEVARITAPYGIVIDAVFLRSVEPDAKTADSISRVAAQERETQIAIEQNNTARKQADARITEAQGAADAAAKIPATITPEQVDVLCLQAWERMAAKAITAGVPLYTSPCGAATTPVVPPAK